MPEPPESYFAHAPHAEIDNTYCVYDQISGEVICLLEQMDNIFVAEWDSFFVATALNVEINNSTTEAIADDPIRQVGWCRFARDFPKGFRKQPVCLEQATGVLSVTSAFDSTILRIRLCQQDSQAQQAMAEVIVGAIASLFERLVDAIGCEHIEPSKSMCES